MLFCQLGRAKSLPDICGGLACCEGKLSDLGITAPRRSTLAYANEHRPWELYKAVFFQLLTRCQAWLEGVGYLLYFFLIETSCPRNRTALWGPPSPKAVGL